jgi:hypothetical protein
VQPSPSADGRYGENPNRVYKHHQFQVILKPAPADVQDLYLQSLAALGIDPAAHDVRFEEDNWVAPTLGAWGIGWQVLLDGQEITQFTYFQQAGGIDLAPISAEITYGLERIAMYLQDVDNMFDVEWAEGVSYGRVRRKRSTSSPLLVRARERRAVPGSLRPLHEGRLGRPERAGRAQRARGLRLRAGVVPRLQHPRRARRHLGEPAGGDDPGHSQAGVRGGGEVRGRDRS